MSPSLVDLIAKGGNLLVNNTKEDTQHGSMTVFELNGTLGELGLPVKVIPAKDNVAVTEVVHKLVASSFDIAPKVKTRGREDKRGC